MLAAGANDPLTPVTMKSLTCCVPVKTFDPSVTGKFVRFAPLKVGAVCGVIAPYPLTGPAITVFGGA